MTKVGMVRILSSSQSGDAIILLSGGREPLRVPARDSRYSHAVGRPDLSIRMRKLLRAIIALKAQGRKK